MTSPIVYTALGDSLTAGVGSFLSTDFVGKYSLMLEHYYQTRVTTNKHAKPKLTSAQFTSFLDNPRIQHDIARSNIVTITTGGNDLLQAHKSFLKRKDPRVLEYAHEQFKKNLHLSINKIFSIHAHTYSKMPLLIQIIGLYNPYPHISHSDFWIRKFNQSLSAYSSRHVSFIELHSPFQTHGEKLLSFGIHPNGNGYHLIAERLLESKIKMVINK